MIVRVIKNDYGYEFTHTLTDENGVVMNLSTAQNVKLYVGRFGQVASTYLVNGGSMTISDAVNGVVTYAFEENAIDKSGYFDAMAEINYSSGKRRVRPFTLHVVKEL